MERDLQQYDRPTYPYETMLKDGDPGVCCLYGPGSDGMCKRRRHISPYHPEATQKAKSPFSQFWYGTEDHLGYGAFYGVGGVSGGKIGPGVKGQGVTGMFSLKEYGGDPYVVHQPRGLSCKWVNGPGGFPFYRCDNYLSYGDVDPNGNIRVHTPYTMKGYREDKGDDKEDNDEKEYVMDVKKDPWGTWKNMLLLISIFLILFVIVSYFGKSSLRVTGS